MELRKKLSLYRNYLKNFKESDPALVECVESGLKLVFGESALLEMQIIQDSSFKDTVDYALPFAYEGHISPSGRMDWGYSFECDKDGNVDESKLNPTALENYKACLTGQVGDKKVIKLDIEERKGHIRIPAIGKCQCGAKVTLDGDVECSCGREYNSGGQELAPRDQWGEETGEAPAKYYED